jgi:hypothetical protein
VSERLSASWRKPLRIDSELARTFPCDTMTPFGSDVDPEVYCR